MYKPELVFMEYGFTMNKKMRIFTKLLFLAGVLLFPDAIFANDIYFKGNLFDRVEKHQVSHEVIAAPIEYRTDSDGNEGYFAPKLNTVKGKLLQLTYDYEESYSAEQLHEDLLTQLQVNRYKVIFSCERAKCGEVFGWKLYLGRLVEGDESHQFYVLAEKEIAVGRKSVVAVYINEFSEQPRVMVTKIDNVQDSPLHTVLFESGSSTLSEAQKVSLKAAQPALPTDGKKLTIVGFSDDVGAISLNEQLAKERAVNVLEYLSQELGIASSQFNIRFLGERFPVAQNSTEYGRSLNRRVEIHAEQ
jgi:outer membrane protein OmpA-like peptidoglycan-associated protein